MGATKKVQKKKVPNFYLKTYSNPTKPNHFVQRYVLYALTPAKTTLSRSYKGF